MEAVTLIPGGMPSRAARALVLREWREQATSLAFCLGVYSTGAALAVAEPAILRAFFDAAAEGFDREKSVLALPAALALSTIARVALTATGSLVSERKTQERLSDLRESILRKAFRRPDRNEGSTRSEILTAIEHDLRNLRVLLGEAPARLVQFGLTTVLCLAYLAYLDPLLAGLTIGACALLVPIRGRFGRLVHDQNRELASRREFLLRSTYDALEGEECVRLAQAQREVRAYLSELGRCLASAEVRLRRREVSWGVSTVSLMAVASAAILLFGGTQLARGSGITLGILVAFFSVLRQVGTQLEYGLDLFSNIQAGLVSAERVARILQSRDGETRTSRSRGTVPSSGMLLLREITFSHPQLPPLLRGVDLAIRKGEWALVTGASGAGKTTLLQIVCGDRAPTRGRVEFAEGALHRIALVPHRPHIFSWPLESNVSMRPGRASLGKMQFDSLLSLVKLDQLKCREGCFVNGGGLSMGERARVGILRALSRNPAVLLLDETLSHIPESDEQEILAGIRNQFPAMTVLAVTHRQSSWRFFERHFHLSAGHLREMKR